MLTRTRINPARGLALGLVTGLVSLSAAATEEVIVHGTGGAAAEAQRVELRAELKEYMESAHRRLKEQLDEQLDEQINKRPAASFEKLALAEVPSRG